MKTTATDRTILLTKKGMNKLRKDIAQLEHDRQRAIQILRDGDRRFDRDGRLRHIEQVATIENLDEEITEKKMTLAHAKLVPVNHNALAVGIGSIVELFDETNNQPRRFTIVNSVEADPSDGSISNLSPLGKVLLGKTVRDVIEWHCGKSICKLRLVRIY